VALTAVVQSTLGPRLRVFGVSPDLVLLFLIAWVLLHGLRGSLSVSLVGGLMLDALSGAPFGLMTLCLTLASSVAGLGQLNVFSSAWYLPYLTIATATLVFQGLLLLFLRLLRESTTAGPSALWGPLLWRVVLPSVLINTLLMLPVHHLVRWLAGWRRGESAPTFELG